MAKQNKRPVFPLDPHGPTMMKAAVDLLTQALPLETGDPAMTGVAFSIEASKDQGFSNYRICTLFVVNGQIVHIERSQEFAAFEAIARTEMLVNSSLWNLSSRYKPGAFQSLGGDARDELVNRLKKSDLELLERISPALGLA